MPRKVKKIKHPSFFLSLIYHRHRNYWVTWWARIRWAQISACKLVTTGMSMDMVKELDWILIKTGCLHVLVMVLLVLCCFFFEGRRAVLLRPGAACEGASPWTPAALLPRTPPPFFLLLGRAHPAATAPLKPWSSGGCSCVHWAHQHPTGSGHQRGILGLMGRPRYDWTC